MARGRGRGRGRGGGRGRGRGRPGGDDDGSDESGEEFEERPKMGMPSLAFVLERSGWVDGRENVCSSTMISITATGGQSATAGMLPPSDSDDDEEEKPAPKPKGQVSLLESLLFMQRDHPGSDCRLACERDRHLGAAKFEELLSDTRLLTRFSFKPHCAT